MKQEAPQQIATQTVLCTAVHEGSKTREGRCAFRINQKWLRDRKSELERQGNIIDNTELDPSLFACSQFAQHKDVECTSQLTATIYYHSAPSQPTDILPHKRR